MGKIRDYRVGHVRDALEHDAPGRLSVWRVGRYKSRTSVAW
jgi:hypothetical protein